MPATKNVWGRYAKVTTLPDGTRGKNKRGTCLHKRTKLAKKTKKQYVPGHAPQEVTAYKPRFQ